MGQTIAEKIFSNSAGRVVTAGEFVDAAIDVAMIHDITGPLAVKTLYEITDRVWDRTKVIMLFDHRYLLTRSTPPLTTSNFVSLRNERGS